MVVDTDDAEPVHDPTVGNTIGTTTTSTTLAEGATNTTHQERIHDAPQSRATPDQSEPEHEHHELVPPQTQRQHLDIANHPVPEVLTMLTALLQKIIDSNDHLVPHHHYHDQSPGAGDPNDPSASRFTANVLAFHGRNIPAISLHAYLTRILKYCPTTNEVFISLLVYFDRIAQRANQGDLHQQHPAGDTLHGGVPGDQQHQRQQLFVMDSYNIHRLIIAGVTVASKFFSDIFYKNSRYAKVGGLPVEELNHLELQFLLLIDFNLMISLEELQRYADLLLRFWQKDVQTQEGIVP